MFRISYFNLLLISILSLNFILIQACNRTIFVEDDDLKALTLKDVLSGKFPLRKFNGLWISAKEFIYINDKGLVEFNVETKTENILLEQKILVTNPEWLQKIDLKINILYNRKNGASL